MRNHKAALLSVGLLASFVSSAVDRYVSADGAYGQGLGECYTDLQAAVTEAAANETVWVQDGFVCNDGSSQGNSQLSRIVVTSKILIRSESGYVDEANGKGATIIGQYNSDATPVGDNAVRCIYLGNAGAELRGFILKNGSTKSNASYGLGGGAGGSGTLSHCLIRDCYGYRGGGVGGLGRCEECVFVNNQATGNGAAIYQTANVIGCTISGGRTSSAIGCYDMKTPLVVSNCTICCNRSTANGGALSLGGSTPNFDVYDSVISNNVAKQSGAAAYASAASPIRFHDCKLIGNVAGAGVNGCNGGATYYCDLENCLVTGNSITNGNGGACSQSVLTDCVVSNNCTAGTSNGSGGALYNCTATNCVVTKNATRDKTAAVNGGKAVGCTISWNDVGVANARCEGCTIADNTGAGARDVKWLSGCTIVRNRARGVYLYNLTGELVITNCTIACNKINERGGGIYVNATPGLKVYDSVISNNHAVSAYTGGGGAAADKAANAISFYRCKILDNVFVGTGNGAHGGGVAYGYLEDCEVCGNVVTNGHGGGVFQSRSVGCTFKGNRAYKGASSTGYAGAVYDSVVSNCVFTGNQSEAGGALYSGSAVKCTFIGNASSGHGGATYGSSTMNCVFTNNAAADRGSGAYNGAHYNALFVGNRKVNALRSYGDAACCAVNCTFTGNEKAGIEGVPSVINCISWGNGVAGDKCTICSDSCIQSLTATTKTRVIDTDPRLATVNGLAYVPRSRGCRNTAQRFDWMSDPADVRSHDVYGQDRIIGSGPDMGAVEAPTVGLLLMVR